MFANAMSPAQKTSKCLEDLRVSVPVALKCVKSAGVNIPLRPLQRESICYCDQRLF